MKQNEEIIGFLKGIKKENGEITLIFEMQKEIKIQSTPDFEKKIRRFLGNKIGIFHLDDNYNIRKLEEK